MHPDYFWWGPMWFFPIIIPFIMIFAMIICFYFMFGRGGFRPPWHHTDRPPSQGGEGESALEILKKRYAQGEITKDEFEQIRKDILTWKDEAMAIELTGQEKQQIEASIRAKYGKVAATPEGQFRYPIGRAGLEALGYDPEILKTLPESVAASYCGVGNPFTLGPIREGEAVLDIGCGAGVDAIIAANLTGPSGIVTGIDLVPEMLARAKTNARLAGVDNLLFQESSAEQLPFPDGSFDVVISNGVFNLVVDKIKALEEVFRVLKPGGRFLLADQVLSGELPKDTKTLVEKWARWEGGAIPGKVFLVLLEQAGFAESELVRETEFNSAPVTKGVLFRAIKPVATSIGEHIKPTPFAAGREGKMEHLLQRALQLGAERAKIIDPETVAVAEWVRWKCKYGCPLFAKDPYHAPGAPEATSMQKVLGEFRTAILLSGPDGKALSEAAVRLEGEAYHQGYYKAFALVALVPSGGAASAPAGPCPDLGATWPSGETRAQVEPVKVVETKPTEPDPGACWPSGQNEVPCEPLKTEEIQVAPRTPGDTWPSGGLEAQVGLQKGELTKLRIRPMMEACGIDVFKTARRHGFEIDTRKETYGRWNYFALLLLE